MNYSHNKIADESLKIKTKPPQKGGPVIQKQYKEVTIMTLGREILTNKDHHYHDLIHHSTADEKTREIINMVHKVNNDNYMLHLIEEEVRNHDNR